ncbi:MAG: hypothetical protein V4622_09565 [Bacteroidota bacterium]
MQSLILNSNSKSNMKLLADLAKKLGVSVKILSNEEKEDYAFFNAMEEGRTGEFVDEEEIFKKLKK